MDMHEEFLKFADTATRRRYKAELKRNKTKQLRELALLKLGNRCKVCGHLDSRALQIDHINGNGSIERKSKGFNVDKYYLKVILDKENTYQCLCANCNWVKVHTNGERGRRGKSSR